ncbi:hypothetical protein P168DRAFT_286676 [Aspergillus campestris IBT 28561]|uniref:Uncharacterized protein n=1 Tax=Aspergillus campestris (strain IBT 28561) TaxID=1392248 RepID=A0A2I1DFD0_ASPC2|nr:uncharacterized protein P168DRAFT_286676 [Aspergillus campestris IBT 28561]PKY08561.1 hypothetical protein P168DRAFT_286676 [Aspergillus campestris IBT 28561]
MYDLLIMTKSLVSNIRLSLGMFVRHGSNKPPKLLRILLAPLFSFLGLAVSSMKMIIIIDQPATLHRH